MRSLATRLQPQEIAELQRLVNSLGVDQAAALCEVSATTLARAVAQVGVYDCTKRRIRKYLATKAATKAAA
jgi:hypothetical protein